MAVKPPNKPRKTITPKQAAQPKSTVTPIGLVATGAEVSHRGTQPISGTQAIHGGIEQEIRLRAYQLFEQRGRKEGYDREDWAQAEAEVLAKYRRDKSA